MEKMMRGAMGKIMGKGSNDGASRASNMGAGMRRAMPPSLFPKNVGSILASKSSGDAHVNRGLISHAASA